MEFFKVYCTGTYISLYHFCCSVAILLSLLQGYTILFVWSPSFSIYLTLFRIVRQLQNYLDIVIILNSTNLYIRLKRDLKKKKKKFFLNPSTIKTCKANCKKVKNLCPIYILMKIIRI